ncbi:hypothetical protein BUE93_09185 [Chromobacterium amazonense]|uniref:Type III secretion system protein SpaM n=1 Tax=Chromobacterium amazonense TaxID=1382803 RepID=A0A2S9X5N0_9NEIS|nr:hypothetical protein [Chromobacterium amazonense]PRP70986.1 hypothetical protein BUE93_09185 [Chromobacterium amazonense]
MRLLPKLRALQQRCVASQRRCEAQLAALAREDDDLRKEEDALVAQGHGLCQLLQAQRPVGIVLERSQLFAILRKQAVMRQQLQNLELQRKQLTELRQALAERRMVQQEERSAWQRKDDKYQRWATRVRKQESLLRLRQDEAEQEERTIWKLCPPPLRPQGRP